MNIVWVRYQRWRSKALLMNNLPEDGETLLKLSNILMGKHPYSKLLRNVPKGTFSEQLGAKKRMLIAFRNVPTGGFGVGGVYAVQNWVTEKLNPIMPNGWGAAMSEPPLFPAILANRHRVYIGFFAAVDRRISPYTCIGI